MTSIASVTIVDKEINKRDYDLIIENQSHPLHKRVKMVVYVLAPGVVSQHWYVTMYYFHTR